MIDRQIDSQSPGTLEKRKKRKAGESRNTHAYRLRVEFNAAAPGADAQSGRDFEHVLLRKGERVQARGKDAMHLERNRQLARPVNVVRR